MIAFGAVPTNVNDGVAKNRKKKTLVYKGFHFRIEGFPFLKNTSRTGVFCDSLTVLLSVEINLRYIAFYSSHAQNLLDIHTCTLDTFSVLEHCLSNISM